MGQFLASPKTWRFMISGLPDYTLLHAGWRISVLSIYRGFSLWRKCDFPPINGLIIKVYQVIRWNQRILEHDISIFGLFTVSVYIYIYILYIHIIIGYINPTSSYFYRLNPQEHVDLSMLNITILRPQEIPPSARNLLTEPRPQQRGPVEVKGNGVSRGWQIKTEYRTQRTPFRFNTANWKTKMFFTYKSSNLWNWISKFQ